MRIFFQNVKGLSYSPDFEDYKYYLSSLKAYEIDIAGLAETNTAWQHNHLQQDLRKVFHAQYRQSKLIFGSPTTEIDPCSITDTFQSGGMVTATLGSITSSIFQEPIIDDTGLGRWNGITLRGTGDFKLSIITAYRTCSGNVRTSSLGSVFSREFLYFRSQQGIQQPNPRRLFFQHLSTVIRKLQETGNCIILMLDANSDVSTDHSFASFASQCELYDMHSSQPAPSTYIGSAHRRIDYIFGCRNIMEFSRRSGALSYFEGPMSDHRGLYVDISIPALCHSLRQQKMSPASHRALHTGNPELVSAYLESVKTYYAQHGMYQRMELLYKNHKNMDKDAVLNLLTKWDNDQGRAMAQAERKISKPPKKHPWSPSLRNAAVLRKYWKLRLRELKYGQCYTETFKRWESEIQKFDPLFVFPNKNKRLKIEEVRKCFNRATKQFRKAQMDSTALRVQTYEDLIRSYMNDDNSNTQKESQRKAKWLLQTIRNETCRRFFSDLRTVLKPSSTTSLSTLLVPSQNEPGGEASIYDTCQNKDPNELVWETVIDRSDIEKHLLVYNREAFRAAAVSPCGQGVIYDAITFTSLSPAAKEVLTGVVPQAWHGDDLVLKEFLASFAIPKEVAALAPIPTEISEEDVRRGFNRWRESTTTSPSGRHLGHYRALIQDPSLLSCLTQFLNIAIYHGVSIPRWRQATNVLIEKDPGRPRINRLRIIHLFEADFNFLLKIIWGSRLVHRAVEHNLLHDGQFGSVPGKTTLDLIMLTQLTTNLSRILKMNMARFENDASACYDRIIVAFGMLAARRCGMPDNAISMQSTHSTALQFMKYAVKTIYGVSTDTYEGTDLEPLFGTGQGSGASPAVWLSLVVLLLNTLEKLIPDRILFDSPNGCTTHRRLVDAFVDDVSLGITDPDSEYQFEDMVERLQEIAQTWEKILSLSGGALNFKKCGWYAVFWEWDKGRPRIRPIRSDDPSVTLRTSFTSSQSQNIPRMSIEQSSRVLGVQLSPSGSFADAIKVYKRKADTFAARLCSPKIGATEALIFHRSIYIPTMRYGLAAFSASEEDMAGVQTKLLTSLLRKLHVSSSIPTAIRHGPIEMGGMALYDMRTEIGIENLRFLRNAIFSHSNAGQMILLNLQYLQLEAGIGECLLEKPEVEVAYLTHSWLVSVREFLAKHNMSITLTDQPTVELAGPRDQFIMQSQHLKRYSLTQQRDINLVRIYLQVNTLADMTDEDQPTRICLSYLDGTRPHEWHGQMRWPRQEIPSSSQRRLWRRYIASSYLRYVPYWKQSPLLDSTFTGSVYKETVRQKPNHSIATTMPLSSYLKTLPRTQRRMVSDVVQVADDVQIWRAFRSKERLYIASDGGLQGNQGTFGWVLTSSKHVLYKCGGPVDGPFDTANSTRSELCGLASSLLLVASVSRNWGLRHRCSFRCIMDSRSAISKVVKTISRRRPDSYQYQEADLLTLIRSLLLEIRRRVNFHWVKGHQDSLKSYDSLPRTARMNIDADFLATRYRLRGKLKSSRTIDHSPEQRVSISILGVRLTSQFDACIRYHINGYHLKQYMAEKRKWDEDTWNLIDFGLFGEHHRKLSLSQRVLHMKFVHGQLPLGVRRHQRSSSNDEALKQCPCCRTAIEDHHHFFRCVENSSVHSGLNTMLKDGSAQAHPLRRILTDGIRHWTETRNSDFRVDITKYPVHMREAIQNILQEQERIGWDNAILGFLSKAWVDLASVSYESSTRLIADGVNRMRRCISALFEYSVGLWKYRNSALHEVSTDENHHLRSTLSSTIADLHNQQDKICFDDRYLCQMPLSKLLKSSPSIQRRWIKRMKESRELYTRLGERQTLITSFFRRSTP